MRADNSAAAVEAVLGLVQVHGAAQAPGRPRLLAQQLRKHLVRLQTQAA